MMPGTAREEGIFLLNFCVTVHGPGIAAANVTDIAMGGQARLKNKSYAFLLSPAGCSLQCFTVELRRRHRVPRRDELENRVRSGTMPPPPFIAYSRIKVSSLPFTVH
jgi:hypothetical protein